MLKKYFPISTNLNIYINSESIDYTNSEFNIINIHPGNPSISWSSRLRECVSKIDEKLVLSIADDFILESEVKMNRFIEALEIFRDNHNCAAVQLVKIPGDKKNVNYTNFKLREYDYRNLISHQAAIWNRKKYLDYIKDNETPWEFEVLSSARGVLSNDDFYCVDDDVDEIFDYNYGLLILKGYWIKQELSRLESSQGLIFKRDARETLDLESMPKKVSSRGIYPSYIKLRFKKWSIIIKKRLTRHIKFK
jgi:hypothetical protein